MELNTTVSFESKPNKDEIISRLNEFWKISGSHRSQIKVTFDKQVRVQQSMRKWCNVESAELYFFISNRENLCYASRKNFKTGFLVSSTFIESIKKLELIIPTILTDEDREKKVKDFVSKFHPNLWTNIQAEILADPQSFKTSYSDNFETVYLTRWFPDYELERLSEAIAARKGISLYAGGRKRTITLTATLGEDDVYRGWVSSEYVGCANGQYFILISEKLAAFSEYD